MPKTKLKKEIMERRKRNLKKYYEERYLKKLANNILYKLKPYKDNITISSKYNKKKIKVSQLRGICNALIKYLE